MNNNKKLTFDDLPKYISIDTGKGSLFFRPTIIKFENEGLSNAYYAMYARYYPKSRQIKPEQVLFFVMSSTFDDLEEKFIVEYKRNESFIKDYKWTGERPLIIDLMNFSVDGHLMVNNINKPKIR